MFVRVQGLPTQSAQSIIDGETSSHKAPSSVAKHSAGTGHLHIQTDRLDAGTGNAHFADQGLSWGEPSVENKIMGCSQEAQLKTVMALGQRW